MKTANDFITLAFIVAMAFSIVMRILVRRKTLAVMKSVFPEMFPELKSIRYFLGCSKVVFRHCGMDGDIQCVRSKNSVSSCVQLKPSSRPKDAKKNSGLTIKVAMKAPAFRNLGDHRRLKDMDEEYFLQHCEVKFGKKTLPGTVLPEAVLQLLRKAGSFTNWMLNVYCGPDRFEVGLNDAVREADQYKELVATSLLLLKELVRLRLEDLPMEELNLPAAYGDVDFINGELLPQSVREHLDNALITSEDAGKDPLLSYRLREKARWGDAYGADEPRDVVYDRVDADAGRDWERVV